MTAVLLKHSAESILYDIDCTRELASGETITAITSVAADAITGKTAPTISGAVVNAAPITYDYGTAAIGKVIQARIAGGGADTWMIRAKYDTTLGNGRETDVQLKVD